MSNKKQYKILKELEKLMKRSENNKKSRILLITVIIAISIIVTACLSRYKKSELKFNDTNISKTITNMEKAINQKDQELLAEITNNQLTTNKLLKDFPDGNLTIKDISHYMLTDKIIRVQLEIDQTNQNYRNKYVILIENNKEGWELYPSGFIE